MIRQAALLLLLLFMSLSLLAQSLYTVARGPVTELPAQPCAFRIGYTADAPLLMFSTKFGETVDCLRLRELMRQHGRLKVTIEADVARE